MFIPLFYTKKLLVPNINGGERTSEKRKRVTRPASLSPLNPATALGSLLSVALSSVTAKSIYMIPSVSDLCQCTTTPTQVYSFERRRCSVSNGAGVQRHRYINRVLVPSRSIGSAWPAAVFPWSRSCNHPLSFFSKSAIYSIAPLRTVLPGYIISCLTALEQRGDYWAVTF